MQNVTKNMKKRIKGPETVEAGKKRTTISIPDKLMEKVPSRIRELSRPSFSNYVEFLIAQDLKQNGEAIAA